MAEGEFDWSSIPFAAVESGHCEAALVGDVASGAVHYSWPLAEDGSYKFWLYGDPYKATVSKEDGSEEEADVYKAYNMTLIIGGDNNPFGQGCRVNQVKYMALRSFENQSYDFEVDGAPVTFTFEKVWFFMKGKQGLVVAIRDGTFYVAICDNNKPEQQTPLCAKGLAIGAYWAHGADA